MSKMETNKDSKNEAEPCRKEDVLHTENEIAKTEVVEIETGTVQHKSTSEDLAELNSEEAGKSETNENKGARTEKENVSVRNYQQNSEEISSVSIDANTVVEMEVETGAIQQKPTSEELAEVSPEEIAKNEEECATAENVSMNDFQRNSDEICAKGIEANDKMTENSKVTLNTVKVTENEGGEVINDLDTTSVEETSVVIVNEISQNVNNTDTENQDFTRRAEENETFIASAAPLSGLNLLAQYCSEESDNDDSGDNNSVIEIPARPDYRDSVVEIKSDSEESDSDSSNSEADFKSKIRKLIEQQEIEGDDEDDDCEGDGTKNDGKPKRREPPKAKGELLLDDLPPIQDLQISVPEDECVELGRIHSIVEQLVLVSALPNSVLLDLETVLFLDRGKKVLGEVFDVIGQVADPLYCIRFNSQKHIQEKNITIGDVVYVAPKTKYTQFVILSKLTQMRGSDASWENDLEPPPRFIDYSDDEEERRARAKASNKDRIQESDEQNPNITQTKEYTSPPGHKRMHSGQRNSHNNSRGRGGYRRSPHQPERFYNNNNPPTAYQYENHNVNSWHSNYYPAYSGGPQFNYRMPQPQMMYPPPMPFNPPYHPYGQMPDTSASSANPTYVLNPYAVMRPGMLPPNHTTTAPNSKSSNSGTSQFSNPY